MAKLTNEQKYKTAEERVKAFSESCKDKSGLSEEGRDFLYDFLNWLALEAEEEKLEPCFYCGDKCVCEGGYLECLNDNCCYSCGDRSKSDAEIIAAHNRVARAVRAAKEGEVK